MPLKDKLLSRQHCWFENGLDGWKICDGSKEGSKVKASTNGTWKHINEEKEITDGMSFKTNTLIFQCKLDKNFD